jgi:hypothetical protein
MLQMSRIRLPGGYFIGTGLITVVGKYRAKELRETLKEAECVVLIRY